jgi:hypothetical protein
MTIILVDEESSIEGDLACNETAFDSDAFF